MTDLESQMDDNTLYLNNDYDSDDSFDTLCLKDISRQVCNKKTIWQFLYSLFYE